MSRTEQRRCAHFVLSVMAAGAALGFGCGAGPEAPPYKPVADVKQLMQAMVDPAADALWEKSGYIVTTAGIEKRQPKTDEEWAALRNHAITITESANLLMMPPRAKDGGLWIKDAQELRTQGEAMWRAADAKDVDRLFTVGTALYEACASCHERYVDAIDNAKK